MTITETYEHSAVGAEPIIPQIQLVIERLEKLSFHMHAQQLKEILERGREKHQPKHEEVTCRVAKSLLEELEIHLVNMVGCGHSECDMGYCTRPLRIVRELLGK